MDSTTLTGALLPPKRRKQIEIWLDEIVRLKKYNECASDEGYGHALDALAEKDRWTSTNELLCPICKHPNLSTTNRSSSRLPASLSSSPSKPVDAQPELSRAKSALRSIKDALTSLKPKSIGDLFDPRVATKMYWVHTSDKDAGSSESEEESLRSSKGGDKVLDERLARLRRAEKLLQRSHPGKGSCQH